MENVNKESTSYSEEVNFEVSRSRSSSMDTELFRVISPLNTPPTDTASRDKLHGSDKVRGFRNMETESMVSGAKGLGLGGRRKVRTEKGKQHEIQRLKDYRTLALRHVTRQISKMKPHLIDHSNCEFVSVELEGLNNLLAEKKLPRIIILKLWKTKLISLKLIHGTKSTMVMFLNLNSLSANICLR